MDIVVLMINLRPSTVFLTTFVTTKISIAMSSRYWGVSLPETSMSYDIVDILLYHLPDPMGPLLI